MKFLICFLSLISVASARTIVCKNQTAQGLEQVTITDSKVFVSMPMYTKPRVFTQINFANGLITDAGLAIYSQNHYGCIRNVLVITDYREPFNAGYMAPIEFGTCSGGSTPDSICGVNGR